MKTNIKNLLVLVLSISILACDDDKKLTVSDKNLEDLVVSEVPNEVTITVNDTINSQFHNLLFEEFQGMPDMFNIGKKHNGTCITLPVEKELTILGGDPIRGRFSYKNTFQKGDSVYITYNNISINNERFIVYPTFKLTNRISNFFEMNFDYLLYKKNVGTKALTPDVYGPIKTVKLDYNKNDENVKFLLDSLINIGAISQKFKEEQELAIVLKRARAKVNIAFNKKDSLNIMNLGASLDRDELYLNNDYLSFLSDVLRYKYFIKRKKYPKPSEVYDYIISNETFLKGKLRVAILKRYLKGIGTSEKRKFDQYLIKFKDVALEKEHLDFLERALNYQKELNGLTNESTGSLRRMKDETVYDFKKVLEREKGKVVLVDFWASWCGPCRKETPFLEKMISSINDSKFIVVSISMDKDSKAWERASKMDGFDKKKHNYLIVDWEKSSLYSDYKIKTIPRYILFNKTGEIIDDDAPRPSNKELKKLIEDNINKASL